MSLELDIGIALLFNAIELVGVFFLFYLLKAAKRKYIDMESRFVQYLESLDKENQKLKTGKEPEKARKDYKTLINN